MQLLYGALLQLFSGRRGFQPRSPPLVRFQSAPTEPSCNSYTEPSCNSSLVGAVSNRVLPRWRAFKARLRNPLATLIRSPLANSSLVGAVSNRVLPCWRASKARLRNPANSYTEPSCQLFSGRRGFQPRPAEPCCVSLMGITRS